MNDQLEGKAVVVTGAATGIGAALARLLVAEGGRVALVDLDPGVRCNSVSPGAIDTPMLRAFDERNPGAVQRLADTSFSGRVGTGQDVAHLCAFLLGAGAAFVNGTDVVVDGGALAAFEPPRAALAAAR